MVITFPQHAFTTRQAQELGISRKQLTAAEEVGLLRRVLRGVYVPAHVGDTLESRAACASLVVAAGSVVRDRTAAWIYGVDVLTNPEHELLPPVESACRASVRPVTGSVWTAAPGTLLPRT